MKNFFKTIFAVSFVAVLFLTGIPAKSIERHVSALIDRNLIEHRGSKKTGGYYAK